MGADEEVRSRNYEAERKIVAPAGKLDLLTVTPNGGVHVVHTILERSVLVNYVRVGDRLLSVDGEDCTCMDTTEVSKPIALNSEKPARVLVLFVSPSTNANQGRHSCLAEEHRSN